MDTTRREALASLAGLSGVAAFSFGAYCQTVDPNTTITTAKSVAPAQVASLAGFDVAKGEYVLPVLPYSADALEPYIDKATMELHHGKHHAAYVAGANRAMKELAGIRDGGDAGLVRHWARELSFHLGGHVNHTLFWNMMAPASKSGASGGGGGEPGGALVAAIRRDFGTFEKFVAHFKANALQVEGGGWGWLVLDTLSKRLVLIQMDSQQDRFIAGAIPILGIDVWEHAYYLRYNNRRSEYVDSFMKVINWRFCEQLFEAAIA
jgi:superoxide dismutase, Fe-Mn family